MLCVAGDDVRVQLVEVGELRVASYGECTFVCSVCVGYIVWRDLRTFLYEVALCGSCKGL